MRPEDVIGLDGIAKKCDVSVSAVRQWRDRFVDFPAPAGYTSKTRGPGSTPWWDWTEVKAWLDKHPKLGNR